jgi:hypothetical protein
MAIAQGLALGVSVVAGGCDAGAKRGESDRPPTGRVVLSQKADPAPPAASDARRMPPGNVDSEKAPPSPPLAEPQRPPPRAEPEPCTDELRISGAAYVPSEHGRSLVVFSGPDVQRSGARSVGMRIADKTLVAIYPNLVVLAGDDGVLCWIRMYGPHARDVVAKEHKEDARAALEKKREEAKKKAAARAARKQKRKR